MLASVCDPYQTALQPVDYGTGDVFLGVGRYAVDRHPPPVVTLTAGVVLDRFAADCCKRHVRWPVFHFHVPLSFSIVLTRWRCCQRVVVVEYHLATATNQVPQQL